MPNKPPSVTRGQPIVAEDYNELIELAAMSTSASGTNVVVDPATGVHVRQQPPERQIIAFEIAAHMPGNGAYEIIVGVPKTDIDFDPASDGADFDFYDYPLAVGETFTDYFVNQAEEGKSGHWLDVGGHYFAWVWPGWASDGLTVYLGHTFDTQQCETEEEAELVI
jgi:hypothetical protein